MSSLLSVVTDMKVASGSVFRPRVCSLQSSGALGMGAIGRAIESNRTGICYCLCQVALGKERPCSVWNNFQY